jgi:hypothetical protein
MSRLSVRHITSRLLALFSVSLLLATPSYAQVKQIDPNDAIGADLGTPPQFETPAPQDTIATDAPLDSSSEGSSAPTEPNPGMETMPENPTPTNAQGTFQKDDLIGAAEGVFGKGAKGLAGLIEDILKKQGQPNGYIVGREGSGAVILGLRYGSGTLHHNVEGQKPVYWTGPSVGFDAGANAGSTFFLVYNLYDTEDLYKRFPAGEGAAYFVGGFNASYIRSGDIVLIPIRLGVGARLGANVGYMKFSKKQNWVPL